MTPVKPVSKSRTRAHPALVDAQAASDRVSPVESSLGDSLNVSEVLWHDRSSIRAGAVRVSFHLHNTESDVDVVARALGG
jgi:selenocysteine lyase/cysteine desulfurase